MKLEFLSNNKAYKGQHAEQIACEYLQHQGLTLIDKNYHCRQGEIDLVMEHNDTLVFVEVRYRKNNLFGGAKESVTYKKQQKFKKPPCIFCNNIKTEMPALMLLQLLANTNNNPLNGYKTHFNNYELNRPN